MTYIAEQYDGRGPSKRIWRQPEITRGNGVWLREVDIRMPLRASAVKLDVAPREYYGAALDPSKI